LQTFRDGESYEQRQAFRSNRARRRRQVVLALTAARVAKTGQTRVFAIIAARRPDGDEVSTTAFLKAVSELEMQVVREDLPVVNTIHFRPGTLTRSDLTLARFFQYLRDYPRCHPSAEFIV
jgi:hypothetical protein